MAEQRVVAGLSCSEVLAMLSDFVDGELTAEMRQQVLDHIAGCNWCEEFGGRFSAVVAALRAQRGSNSLDDDVAARLMEHVAKNAQR